MIPVQTASRHPVTHILFSPDGSAVAVAQPHHGVTLLERASGRTLAVCAMPRRAELTGLTFCGDGKYLAAAHAKGLEVFDGRTGCLAVSGFHHPHKNLTLADRGESVIGVNGGGVRSVWKADTPNEVSCRWRQFIDRREPLVVDALSPGGQRALATTDANTMPFLYDLETCRVAAAVEHPEPEASPFGFAASFCPLGKRFAINDGRTIDVYDTDSLAEEDEGEQQADTPLVQRAGGTRAAVAPRPHMVLFPTFSLKPEKPTDAGHWYPPFALASDGRGVLVKRPRNRVQWWDAPSGTLVNEWSWGFEWVTCVAASPDGLTAAAGGRFGRVLLWDLDP